MRSTSRSEAVPAIGPTNDPLPGTIVADPNIVQRGAIVGVEPVVIDLARPRVLGERTTPLLAVTATGHVLTTGQRRPGEGVEAVIVVEDLPRGPLRWIDPRSRP